MKNFACFFLIPLFGCALASADFDGFQRYEHVRGIISDLVNNTVNDIAKNMSEPMTLNNTCLSFNDTNTLSGGVNVTNITIGGLSGLVAPFIDVDIWSNTVNMTLEVPKLRIGFNYWLDVVLGNMLPLYGSGNSSNITIDNLVFNISGILDMTGGIKLQNVSVSTSVGSSKFNITGLLDSPEVSTIISTILNDTFSDFINNNSEMISKVLNFIIEKILDGMAKLDSLYGIFKGEGYWIQPYSQ